MRTKLSIGIAAAAMAGISFVALQPTHAEADVARVKAALTKAPKLHAITVNAKNEVVREAWVSGGKVRVDQGGRQNVFVATVSGQNLTGEVEAVWTKVENPGSKIADLLFEFQGTPVVGKPLDGRGVTFSGNMAPKVVTVQGKPLSVEEATASGLILVRRMPKQESGVWQVILVDRKTDLPLTIEQRKKNGKNWTVEFVTSFDYKKPIPARTFEVRAISKK